MTDFPKETKTLHPTLIAALMRRHGDLNRQWRQDLDNKLHSDDEGPKSFQPNCRGEYGDTPLHWAAMHGDKHTTRELLLAAVDTSAQDVNGHTPKQLARQYGNHAVALMIENHESNRDGPKQQR